MLGRSPAAQGRGLSREQGNGGLWPHTTLGSAVSNASLVTLRASCKVGSMLIGA